MTKISQTIFITADDINVIDGKITVKKGSFYFNGKKYNIENGDIKHENENI